MEIKGLSIQQILSMDADDIARLDNATLSKVTGRLVSASNKRLRRLEKSSLGKYSPAYVNAMKTGFFSTRKRAGEMGMNYRNRLVNTFVETKQFLNMKTSTIAGWKDVRTDIETRIDGKMTHNQAVKFWKTYRKLQARAERNGLIVGKQFGKSNRNSERVQKMLYKSFKEKGWSSSQKSNVEDILNNLQHEYEVEKSRQANINRAEMEEIEDAFDDIDLDGNE